MIYCCFTKAKSPFFFFLQYAAPLLDNVIKILSPPLKAKSAMSESLDVNLPRVGFVYNVEKSYVAIDCALFFIYVT